MHKTTFSLKHLFTLQKYYRIMIILYFDMNVLLAK